MNFDAERPIAMEDKIECLGLNGRYKQVFVDCSSRGGVYHDAPTKVGYFRIIVDMVRL